MIQTSKKSILAFALVIAVLCSTFTVPAFASGTEADPVETVTVALLSDDGDVIATFSSQEEFELYMSGPSPRYVTCGTGLYWHGQYTYRVESKIETTFMDEYGNVTIFYLTYVQIRCSSCDGLLEDYYE